MPHLARNGDESAFEKAVDIETNSHYQLRDYVPYIHRAMGAQHVSIRQLSFRTGIDRNRLGHLLKRDTVSPSRSSMMVFELQKMLHALNLDVIQAVLDVEALRDLSLLEDCRFSTMLAMISDVFSDLPMLLVQALNEIEGMDGSEIRKEWAIPLRKGVIERVVKAVTDIIQRRRSQDLRL